MLAQMHKPGRLSAIELGILPGFGGNKRNKAPGGVPVFGGGNKRNKAPGGVPVFGTR
jgi:hypothetical protein